MENKGSNCFSKRIDFRKTLDIFLLFKSQQMRWTHSIKMKPLSCPRTTTTVMLLYAHYMPCDNGTSVLPIVNGASDLPSPDCVGVTQEGYAGAVRPAQFCSMCVGQVDILTNETVIFLSIQSRENMRREMKGNYSKRVAIVKP